MPFNLNLNINLNVRLPDPVNVVVSQESALEIEEMRAELAETNDKLKAAIANSAAKPSPDAN